MPHNEFGRKLKSIRLSQNMSIDELSKATGLSHGYIESLEHGSVCLSRDAILSIAPAFGADSHELLCAAGFVDMANLPRFYTSVIAREGEITSVEYGDNLRELSQKLHCKLIDVNFGQNCSATIFDNHGMRVYKYISQRDLRASGLNEYYCNGCDVIFREPAREHIRCPECKSHKNVEVLRDQCEDEHCVAICDGCQTNYADACNQ